MADRSVNLWFANIDMAAAENVVAAATIMSIVAAAGFGLMALFTEYRDGEGRTTVYGRLAAAGVVLTALLSLAINTLQGSVDSAKAARARTAVEQAHAEENGRFVRQLGQFGVVLDRQGQSLRQGEVVRRGMERTLSGQTMELAASRAISRDLAQTAGQSQRNASTLLHSLWSNADRLSGRDISVSVETKCVIASDNPLFEELRARPPEAIALLSAADPQIAIILYRRADLREADLAACNNAAEMCDRERTAAAIAINGQRHTIDEPHLAVHDEGRPNDYIEIRERSEYSGFTVDAGPLAQRSQWNDGAIGFTLASDTTPFADRLVNAVQTMRRTARSDAADTIQRRAPFASGIGAQHWNNVPTGTIALQSDQELLPCLANARLELDHQFVDFQTGRFITAFEERSRGRVAKLVLAMPKFIVAANAFPTFASITR